MTTGIEKMFGESTGKALHPAVGQQRVPVIHLHDCSPHDLNAYRVQESQVTCLSTRVPSRQYSLCWTACESASLYYANRRPFRGY